MYSSFSLSNNTRFWKILSICSVLLLSLFSTSTYAEESGTTPPVVTSNNDPLGTQLCNILKVILGRTSKVIAIVGIFATGVGALTGRLQWTTCIVVACGVLLMFLAPQIVDWFIPADSKGISSDSCWSTP